MIVTTDAKVAADAIRDGRLVAVPTETVYGLAADANSDIAVAQIFHVKGRPTNHPLIVHVASVDDLDSYATDVPEFARRLCDAFWPGPLTLVLERRAGVCEVASGGLPTIAIRCPDHSLTLEMVRLAGTAIAAPSANKFGRVSPTSAAHVIADLGSEIAVVLDGGPCDIGVESTIVDCTVTPPVILRPGGISSEQIVAIVGKVGSASDTPAPGTLPSHYSPQCEVRVCVDRATAESVSEEATASSRTNRIIDYGSDLVGYAKNLYNDLRACDVDGISLAIAVLPPADGIGIAIRDRLIRSAHRE